MNTKITKQWKFLKKGLKSKSGTVAWKVGKWEKHEGILDICHSGFHSSNDPYHAFSYVRGEILARVECRGEHIDQDDKSCWREQRVIKAYKWTKKDSLKLAIFSAELVLKNFEDKHPNDLRPRRAIEAAKKVLFRDTEKNRSAAESAAWSAWSAESAASAARSAAESAAESAAWSAAWSAAESAAWSAAWSAARSAAESAATEKIQTYFMKLVKNLKPL